MKIWSFFRDFQLETKGYVGILIIRVFLGLRLIYGVIDNILSWERMMEFSKFLQSNGFNMPTIFAVLSVYAQFFCAILIIIGYRTRLASFILIINFIIAAFVHIRANDSIENMTPALAMLFICVTLFFTGADKIGLDEHYAKSNG